MKLFVTAIASYPEGTALADDDLEAIKEDIDDCLRYTGPAAGAHSVFVETEVKA